MSSDNEDAQFQVYKNDSRIPCQYGIKCYQKNPQHHSKYKHPPKREPKTKLQTKTITKRKQSVKRTYVENEMKAQSESPNKKLRKTCDFFERNLHALSPSSTRSDGNENRSKKDDNPDVETEASINNTTPKKVSLNQCNRSPNLVECKTIENILMPDIDVQKIILKLFLVEMPKDFFQFYEFCKSISRDDPLTACKSVHLKLVGPYEILEDKIRYSKNEDVEDRLLIHWRYYYDPPEFQTVIKCNDKEGLHFGYWRDDVIEKPAFVAKNQANMNCVFESVAENIFGAVNAYLQDKAKSANPFEKTGIMRLHSHLQKFAKQHNITLERNTAEMKLREKRVVARTFHKIGIVVPYNKKTQLGYRDLAATDNDLKKILKQIEEASTLEERKVPLAKLDEVVRLATIAADECDFGTCLELGHDLFSNGSVHVQSRALQMLTIAYTHLQRPQLLKILQAHLKDRKKSCELSVI